MSTTDLWRYFFPDAQPEAGIEELFNSAQLVTLPAGTPVFSNGGPCHNYLLVVHGDVRVQLLTEGGREVVLYHVRAGESCVLTTSCLLGAAHYPAEGITETEVTAVALPAAVFNKALDVSSAFRQRVFGNLGQRLAEVIVRMEQVAFAPLDRRLAEALLSLSEDGHTLAITHQALAVELGSAREVVSRHLKRFEEQGWVRLGRNSIEVLDRPALQRLAQSH